MPARTCRSAISVRTGLRTKAGRGSPIRTIPAARPGARWSGARPSGPRAPSRRAIRWWLAPKASRRRHIPRRTARMAWPRAAPRIAARTFRTRTTAGPAAPCGTASAPAARPSDPRPTPASSRPRRGSTWRWSWAARSSTGTICASSPASAEPATSSCSGSPTAARTRAFSWGSATARPPSASWRRRAQRRQHPLSRALLLEAHLLRRLHPPLARVVRIRFQARAHPAAAGPGASSASAGGAAGA